MSVLTITEGEGKRVRELSWRTELVHVRDVNSRCNEPLLTQRRDNNRVAKLIAFEEIAQGHGFP